MKDKDLLIEAIDNSFQYTPKQRAILNLFINLEINDTVSITPRELAKILNTSKTTIYISLNYLEKEGLVNRITTKGKHFSMFRLNKSNLKDLMEIYLKKKDYLKISGYG